VAEILTDNTCPSTFITIPSVGVLGLFLDMR